MKKQKHLPEIIIRDRKVGPGHVPFVIAEIGINHEGSMEKAKQMVKDAKEAGAECVKFQSHVIEDEMIPVAKEIIPGNADVSIWEIMERCAFDESQEIELKEFVEDLGMIYLSTPFSRAAADRLNRMGVSAYKIGSGECNNYPLIEHIAGFGKPIIVSTGMNDIEVVEKVVKILRKHEVPYALLHCTSMYPTPYDKVRVGAVKLLSEKFTDAVVGLSDHSLGNYTCFAAVALGGSILEKHFTSDKTWPGPDVSISIDPSELEDLIKGSKAIFEARGDTKDVLKEEQPTIDFAYACVVAISDIKEGEEFTKENIWVKRPGTGDIKAESFEQILGKKATCSISKNAQLEWSNIG